MPLCGYNELMGKGLNKLAEGLNAALGERAERLGLTMQEQMAQEDEELRTFADMLGVADAESTAHPQMLKAWKGLVPLFQYLMQPEESGVLSREEFEVAVLGRAQDFDGTMREFEDVLYTSDGSLRERLEHALKKSLSV